jgi:hypothetical protein
LNITPEKDLTCRRHHCRCFLCKETGVTIATVANDVDSQQWQWWWQATAANTEAVAGAHSSGMAAEMAFAAVAEVHQSWLQQWQPRQWRQRRQ